jgi:hypothetical protein
MKLWDYIKAWRQRRAHAAYVRERDWQKSLHERDADESLREMFKDNAASQATFTPNQ